jgi:hypothetical protein
MNQVHSFCFLEWTGIGLCKIPCRKNKVLLALGPLTECRIRYRSTQVKQFIAGLGVIVTAVWRITIMAGPGAGHWSLRNGQESATALPLLPCFATS